MSAGKQHSYSTTVTWTGNRGTGTSAYTAYGREYDITAPEKSIAIPGSSDPSFRGDKTRYNPEEMLVASLSACHMLWFLHLASVAKIVVTDYRDEAMGQLMAEPTGAGQFTEVVLHPTVTLTDISRAGELDAIHHKAHEMCFVARSVSFPVRVEGTAVPAT